MSNISWEINFELYVDAMGYADSNSTLSAVEAECTDNDNDLYSVEGGVCGPVDCNDNSPQINPDAVENPFDLYDSNCNGNNFCFISTVLRF